MDLRDISAVLPLHFFEVGIEITQDFRILERYSEYLDEEPFHEIEMKWGEEGLFFHIRVDKGFEKAFFPQVEKGDGVEFFIDTRGIEDALIVHKYCHHFVFLPKEVDGVLGVEVTRFKTNDTRELCKRECLKVTSQFSKNSYTISVCIPREALFGYDPFEYSTLKMAYIIHRGSNESNHFPKSNRELNVKDHPSLWATLYLK